jgi:hypothetical protein
MIIFINDDRSYLAWVKSHRGGFVLDAPRRSGRAQRVLHLASCAEIRLGKRRHWTTGQRLKACCLDMAELLEWSQETAGAEPSICQTCRPGSEAPADGAGGSNGEGVRLSPLSGNVLNFVLESTVVQLTNNDPGYRLTVADIATCLGKTVAQLRPALQRLTEATLLEISPPARKDGSLARYAIVAPTASALRTLPAYAESSDDELEAELERLSPRVVGCSGTSR